MASTSGSSAACSTSATTGSNASYGMVQEDVALVEDVEDCRRSALVRAPERASGPGRAGRRTPAGPPAPTARADRAGRARGRGRGPRAPACSTSRSTQPVAGAAPRPRAARRRSCAGAAVPPRAASQVRLPAFIVQFELGVARAAGTRPTRARSAPGTARRNRPRMTSSSSTKVDALARRRRARGAAAATAPARRRGAARLRRLGRREPQRQVEAERRQQRKRPRLVDGQRRQRRQHLVAEVRRHRGPLGRRRGRQAGDADAVPGQRRAADRR